jgi:hypothetical protein
MEDTCPYPRVSRERLGKNIEYGNYSYLFIGSARWSSTGVQVQSPGFCMPPTGLLRLPLSPFVLISRSPPPLSSLPLSPPQADLDTHGGKEPGSSRERMGLFFGDGEEAGGVSSQWSSATEGESEPAGVEGAVVRPPGAGAPRGVRGELRRFP